MHGVEWVKHGGHVLRCGQNELNNAAIDVCTVYHEGL